MSPRPKKPRNCSCELKDQAFKPTGIALSRLEKIALLREEVEALKLCDLDGLSQEEAGSRMGVSRGTVQRVLASARRKTADALAGCKALILEESACEKKP